LAVNRKATPFPRNLPTVAPLLFLILLDVSAGLRKEREGVVEVGVWISCESTVETERPTHPESILSEENVHNDGGATRVDGVCEQTRPTPTEICPVFSKYEHLLYSY